MRRWRGKGVAISYTVGEGSTKGLKQDKIVTCELTGNVKKQSNPNIRWQDIFSFIIIMTI